MLSSDADCHLSPANGIRPVAIWAKISRLKLAVFDLHHGAASDWGCRSSPEAPLAAVPQFGSYRGHSRLDLDIVNPALLTVSVILLRDFGATQHVKRWRCRAARAVRTRHSPNSCGRHKRTSPTRCGKSARAGCTTTKRGVELRSTAPAVRSSPTSIMPK